MSDNEDERRVPSPLDFNKIIEKATANQTDSVESDNTNELEGANFEIDNILNQIQVKYCPYKEDINKVQEAKETEKALFYDKIMPGSETQVDKEWDLYLNEANASLIKSQQTSEDVKELLSLKCSFSGGKSITKNGKLIIPRQQSTYQMNFSATPLYDLILRMFDSHSMLVNEYDLINTLEKNEKLLNDK